MKIHQLFTKGDYQHGIKLPAEFRFAIEASKKSDHQQHKLGAAVYHNGKFIAAGFNQHKTHPLMRQFEYQGLRTLHAEVHALTKAKAKKFEIGGATVFVFRQNKAGELANAKPCAICMSILQSFDVKEVFFTEPGGWEKLKI